MANKIKFFFFFMYHISFLITAKGKSEEDSKAALQFGGYLTKMMIREQVMSF